MNNINSFTETVNKLTKQVNIALASMQGMNDSLTTNEDTVTIQYEGTDPVSGDASVYTFSMPSYQYTLEQLNRISNTVNTFVSGEGVVLLNDGTYREVKTVPLAKTPLPIIDIGTPAYFNIKDNWFFESLIFPQMYVQFNLKNKIDDRSDRVKIRRLIFDNFDDVETQWFLDNLSNKSLTYSEVITTLDTNEKRYWIDEEVQDLPINMPNYTGSFIVIDKRVIDNNEWFFLNTVNYALTSDSSIVNNIELKLGDQLRFSETLYKINSIEITEKRISLTPLIGIGVPNVYSEFNIYSIPFEEKVVNVPVGYNECQSVFIKGINDDYNILGDSWGNSISFFSNNLLISNGVTTLESYYHNYVIDFGKQMEGQAKEKFISAYFGVTPNAPSISTDQFSVNQINTQLNASLDTEEIKNTQIQIESTKTIIASLKSTITQQKAALVELTVQTEREELQAKIDSNITQLELRTTEYQSLVKSLATLAYENDAVLSTPKYRLRGFFEIPEGSKKTTDPDEPLQEIIQFDIAYRYLKLDNTGTALNTYSYVDPSTSQKITGTFTDWTIYQSPIKSRVYDSTLEKYVWKSENIADGDTVNINQVDIPIIKGEKVELKIRSISEAGWPQNPLKSDWSETIIINFPANLEGSDQVANILSDSIQESSQIQLDQTLNATGLITHINDSYPNPNTGDGTYFKHQSKYLSYDLPEKDANNIISSIKTTDLQNFLQDLVNKTYVTLVKPPEITSPSVQSPVTGTLQMLFQAMVNADPSIYKEFEYLITNS